MKTRTMARHLREGLKSVIRNGWMTFASISSICISLFILGMFLLLTLNVNHITKNVDNKAEIKVYMDTSVARDQDTAYSDKIKAMPEVKQVTFITKEEGIKYMREKFGESAGLLDGLEGDENPLNDSFIVELKQPSLQGLETVAKKIEDLNGTANPKPIEKVEYGKGSIEKLFQITSIVRNVGLVFVILLSITSIFLISNTIKLTILNRRREISIMKLVGATNQFIRWPFFVEGALLGLIGSLIPIGVLLYGYYEIVISTREDLGLVMINLLTIPEVSYILVGIILAIGIVIGIWGSTLSVRKYLKV